MRPRAESLLGLFVFALLLRLAHAALVLRSPVGDALILDARYYHVEALRLLGMLPAPKAGVRFMNVGYPYVLATVYALCGARVAAVLVVQSLLGAATSLFVALSAARIARSAAAGIVAGALYAMYRGSLFYDALLLTPCVVNFALALALLLVLVPRERRALAACAAGLVLGLATLMRANALLLLPLWLPAFGRARRVAAAFVFGTLLLPGAVILWNAIAWGQWAPVSANAGMNLWIGNNRLASGIYESASFIRGQDAGGERAGFLEEARRRSGTPLSLAEADRFWQREAFQEIRAAPGHWLKLLLHKAALVWSADEVRTNVGLPFLLGISPVLRFTPVRFALLALAGAAGLGLFALHGERRFRWLVVGLVAMPVVTVLAFFVSGEYRHPLALPLCIAAGTLAFGEHRLRKDRILPALLPLVIVAPLVFWPRHELRALAPSIDTWNFVGKLTTPGPRGEAPTDDALQRAAALAALAPGMSAPDLLIQAARLRACALDALRRRDPAQVRAALDAARAILAVEVRAGMPDYPAPFPALLRASLRESLSQLLAQDFVRSDASLSRELVFLGANGWQETDAFLARHDLAGAESFLRACLERAPHEPQLQAAWGALLLARGQDDEGLKWLERSCNGWPELPDCAHALSVYALEHGDLARARAFANEALRRDAGYGPAKELLRRIEDR